MKKNIRNRSIFILCLFLLSCQNKLSNNNDFLVKIDSIHCPDSVVSNKEFNIEFFGTIGFNVCDTFKTFNTVIKDNDISIETWATSDYSQGLCPDKLVSLKGKKLPLTIPFQGIYKIKIKEPDNSGITKLVIVK
jgi:hypothetical protein